MANASTIKFGDNLDVTDEGAGVIRVDGGGASLPSWWTVVSTPGSESVDFAGAVEVNPGRDVSSLVLRGFAGNTEHILQVFDDAGDLAVDIDSGGILDARLVAIQDPPDTGGGVGTGVTEFAPGRLRFTTQDGVLPVEVKTPSPGNQAYLVVRNSGFGGLLEISPVEDDDTAIVIVSSLTPTVDAFQIWDNAFNNTIFAITASGGLKPTLPTANPGAGILWNDGGTVKVGT